MIDCTPLVNHQQLGLINKQQHHMNMEISAPRSRSDLDPDKVMLTRNWRQRVAITLHIHKCIQTRGESVPASHSQWLTGGWMFLQKCSECLSIAFVLHDLGKELMTGKKTHAQTHTHIARTITGISTLWGTLSLGSLSEWIDFDLSGVDFQEQIIEPLNLICCLRGAT